MAKFDLNVELKNLDGLTLVVAPDEPLKDADGNVLPAEKQTVNLTAANAIIKALIADLPANMNDSTDVKNEKYLLAKKIKAAQGTPATDTDPEVPATAVSLKSEEVTLVKKVVGVLWGVMTVGAIIGILEAE